MDHFVQCWRQPECEASQDPGGRKWRLSQSIEKFVLVQGLKSLQVTPTILIPADLPTLTEQTLTCSHWDLLHTPSLGSSGHLGVLWQPFFRDSIWISNWRCPLISWHCVYHFHFLHILTNFVHTLYADSRKKNKLILQGTTKFWWRYWVSRNRYDTHLTITL